MQKKLEEIADEKNQAQNEIDKEEAQEQQAAIDATERQMLAARYEQMMIEDEHRDNSDGDSNFKVITDQAAEQNYAVNVYKGSGEMSGMLDQMKKEAQDDRMKQMLSQAATGSMSDISAAAGEKVIQNDDQAMFAFSSMMAGQ